MSRTGLLAIVLVACGVALPSCDGDTNDADTWRATNDSADTAPRDTSDTADMTCGCDAVCVPCCDKETGELAVDCAPCTCRGLQCPAGTEPAEPAVPGSCEDPDSGDTASNDTAPDGTD